MTTASSDREMSRLAALAGSSVATILALQESTGAYPASPTFSAYRGYSWFRDGAFIADAMSAYGEVGSANSFHSWCARILVARKTQIEGIAAAAASGVPVADADMLATRFTFDGEEGTDEWWDFQLDGYGTWLWAVIEHARRHSLPLDEWHPAIVLAVDYLASSWSRPCFDWWEENAEQVHVSTLGCIAAGLESAIPFIDAARAAAARGAIADIRQTIFDRGLVGGHLAKWLDSTEVDASLLSIVSPLNVYPATSSIGRATIAAIDEQLTVDGGVHRYLLDVFYGGGQWPLLSCMLGLAFAAAGERDRALEQLYWAAGTATAEGDLPEQVDDHLLAPEHREEWVDRWGTVATPLLWSHAMYVRLFVELDLKASL